MNKFIPLHILSFLILFHFLFLYSSFAQTNKTDSLEKVLQSTTADSSRVQLLNNLSADYRSSNPEKSIRFARKAIELASGNGLLKGGLASAYNNLGNVNNSLGDYDSAIIHFKASIAIKEELHDKKGLGASCYNLGTSYIGKGNYQEGLRFYLQSLKVHEETNNRKGMASTCNGLGLFYNDMKNYPEALKYYERALKVYEDLNYPLGIATVTNNLGLMMENQNRFSEALTYYMRCLKLSETLGDKFLEGTLYGNIGDIHYFNKEYDEAIEYTKRSLTLREEIGDKGGLVLAYLNLGGCYLEKKDYRAALTYLEFCVQRSVEMGEKKERLMAYGDMTRCYSELKDFQKALDCQKLYTEVKDSLFNENSSKQIAEMSTKYQSDKKDKAIQLLNKDNALKEKEAEQHRTQRNAFIAGFVLIGALCAFIFRGYRQKQNANRLLDLKNQKIEHAYKIIEEKNKDITDSINYAKRIQNAILPSEKEVRSLLPNSFVFFKPKDIVSGDFYYVEQKGALVFFCVADCTGHGVPGAMVSVVGHNGLTRAVREFGLTEPASILDKLSALVEETFSKSEGDVKDGMDISFCSLHTDTGILEWAGANNPLWIIHAFEGRLEEIKADKQPIGKYENRKPFSSHRLKLVKGDLILCFSDGYADQFGGDKGKKFKYKKLQELLLSIHTQPMNQQRETLHSTFEQWKGQLEQVDDVCIIGLRI